MDFIYATNKLGMCVCVRLNKNQEPVTIEPSECLTFISLNVNNEHFDAAFYAQPFNAYAHTSSKYVSLLKSKEWV